ncbi:hypothetical protein HZS_4885 [Henneguya salminicola]|nr:hypothetical protein HZS_4885 [Henneguya salminicola]
MELTSEGKIKSEVSISKFDEIPTEPYSSNEDFENSKEIPKTDDTENNSNEKTESSTRKENTVPITTVPEQGIPSPGTVEPIERDYTIHKIFIACCSALLLFIFILIMIRYYRAHKKIARSRSYVLTI